jgi:hypothetical protein
MLGCFFSLTTFAGYKAKMKKSTILLTALLFCISTISQTLQSPEQFLGYKVGTHYTPHYKILEYVKALLRQACHD